MNYFNKKKVMATVLLLGMIVAQPVWAKSVSYYRNGSTENQPFDTPPATDNDQTFKDYKVVFDSSITANYDYVYGAYNEGDNNTFTNNTVTVGVGGSHIGDTVFGAYSAGDAGCKVTGNRVLIDSTYTDDSLKCAYGGSSLQETSDNILTVSGGFGMEDMCGGEGGTVATGNVLTIEGGNFGSENNEISFGGGVLNGADGVNGAKVNNNRVILKGGTTKIIGNLDFNIFGGADLSYDDSVSGEVRGNTVDITNYTIVNGSDGSGGVYIYGGYASGEAETAAGNKVTVTKLDVDTKISSVVICGGKSRDMDGVAGGTDATDGNKVIINDTTVSAGKWDAFAGEHQYDDVAVVGGEGVTESGWNVVEIKAGRISGDVVGGMAEYTHDNSIIVTGGYVEGALFGGKLYGGVSAGGLFGMMPDPQPIEKNHIEISGGTIIGAVTGGYCGDYNFSPVTENTVKITGGKLEEWAVCGGYSDSGSPVTGNVVSIEGSVSFDGNSEIIGGFTSNPYYTSDVDIPTASGNTITIMVDSLPEYTGIIGGLAGGMDEDEEPLAYDYKNDAGKSIDVTGNTVDIREGGPLNLGMLYGGAYISSYSYADYEWEWDSCAGIPDSKNGNILKLGRKDVTAEEFGGFQIYNFILPAGTKDGDIMLTVSKGNVDLTDAKIDVDTVTNEVELAAGDTITLIKCDDGTVDNFDKATDKTVNKEAADETVLTIKDNKLVYIATGPDFDPEKDKAPAEAMSAVAAVMNEGGDLSAGQGMTSLINETVAAGLQTYGAFGGGHSRYKTGSHVDSDSFNIMIGAGKKIERAKDKWIYGVFFEYGKSDFDTYNVDSNGEGDANYKGLGVQVRREMKNGIFTEGSIRGGKNSMDWASSNFGKYGVSYDTDSIYYAFHVAVGRDIRVSDKGVFTPYGKYTFGHTGGDDAKIGDNSYSFDSVNSHRFRGGVRYAWKKDGGRNYPYIGAAFEHEFDSDAAATVSDKKGKTLGSVHSPSLKGNTGVFEAGYNLEAGKWTLGVAAEAFTGKRKGWTGSVNAFFSF